MEPEHTTLTQAQLVAELRSHGYSDASETRVATWRKLELLPQFTGGGSGQGRGAGRSECFWTDPVGVVDQAVAIIDLLITYDRLEELYLPLWQMGFEIPLHRVRSALVTPLLKATEDFQEDGSNGIEDLIDDAVAKICLVMRRRIPVFAMPEESLAVVINVLTNPKYAFCDQPYEEGISKLKEWEVSFARRVRELFGKSIQVNQDGVARDNDLLRDVRFINRYLSLPNLVSATQECTTEELKQVQRDLELGRQILLLLKRIVDLLCPFLPESWRFRSADMRVVFNVGRILVWVDLALRRRGFDSVIDNLIPQILNQLRNDFDEAAERELQAAGPEIGKTLHLVQTIFTGGAAATSGR